MSDGVDFRLTGLDEVLGRMGELSDDIRYKGGRFAARKAAMKIVEAAKANAGRFDDPATAAEIAENVALRWSPRRFKRTGDLMFRVGVLGGAGGNKPSSAFSQLPGGDTRHWRLMEFGFRHKRSGRDIPAQPFLRDAARRAADDAISEFAKQYPKAMERALRRAKKKTGAG